MRVSVLYIIGLCDCRSNEVVESCKALFQKYKIRTTHRPNKIELILLDGDSEAYKSGKQFGKQENLHKALLKNECDIWKDDSEPVTNNNSTSGKDGKSEISGMGRVGVYFVAHGQTDSMYSNTKPAAAANVIVWATGKDAVSIDKLVLLACHVGRVTGADSQSPKGFIVALCQVLAGKAPKDMQQNFSYKDVTCNPKVAGWDAIVSVYFNGTTPNFTPANAPADAVGRKVIEGGVWGADARNQKNAFQVTSSGSLQKLDLIGWSDKA